MIQLKSCNNMSVAYGINALRLTRKALIMQCLGLMRPDYSWQLYKQTYVTHAILMQ